MRFRLTLIATLLVAVALGIAGAGLSLALNHILTESATSAGLARAEQLTGALEAGGMPAVTTAMMRPDDDIDIVQIIDSSSRVVRSSATEFHVALAFPVRPGVVERRGHLEADFGSDYRATIAGARSPAGGDYTVIVAFAGHRIERTVITVVALCCFAFPLIVAGVGWLTYHLVGRTLRPVEDLRSHAAEITGGDLSNRLPVPGTGDEIDSLARTMNEMLARLEASRQRQSQFVNDASHELNSPLTSILGIVEPAAAGDRGVDAATVHTVVLPEALRLKQLIADLLFLARADERGVARRDILLDLDDLVLTEVERLRHVSALDLEVDIVAARVRGDAAQLGRALCNLTDNAMQHAEDRVALLMRVDDGARTVAVSVIDDGPGIPDADRARIFDRFVRLDADRERRAGGTGLGLAIVAEIAGAHGGHVAVVPSESGTRIDLTLPLAAAQAEAPPSAARR
ncbi:ATP-binding protein [Gordonia sp. (in: high G+C Gram-positive bacteria)]|uniref:ATP-binding protein n=1 Tax=Gordonia sp. (in: high G+C Gram-positive bacteria) TaxID=84139 RepID=UPI003526C624